MPNKCTWLECNKQAVCPQLDRYKNIWADLCQEHHDLLDDTLGDPNKIPAMLSYWIKAQGSAKAITDSRNARQ